MGEDEFLLGVQILVIGSIDSDDLGGIEGVELLSNCVEEAKKLVTVPGAVQNEPVLLDLVDGVGQSGGEMETGLPTLGEGSGILLKEVGVEISHDSRGGGG